MFDTVILAYGIGFLINACVNGRGVPCTSTSLNDMLKIELNKQMITNIKEEYIVEYIQKPFIPENKYYPKRTQLTFFFTLFGLLISILYILFKHYIFVKNKKNP